MHSYIMGISNLSYVFYIIISIVLIATSSIAIEYSRKIDELTKNTDGKMNANTTYSYVILGVGISMFLLSGTSMGYKTYI